MNSSISDNKSFMESFDLAIIGAGAAGLACAWLISRGNPGIKLCVIEKEADVAFGTSGRNSAVVHAGFNNPPGFLRSELCVQGNREFEGLAGFLGVEYIKTGKLVVGFTPEDRLKLEALLEQGQKNSCQGLEIINRDRMEELAPDTKGEFALFSPETAIFNPFRYCAALAEGAAEAGARFFFGTEVTGICKASNLSECGDECNSGLKKVFHIEGKTGVPGDGRKSEFRIEADRIINAAGLGAGRISAMAGAGAFEIRPCRGEYHILEKKGASQSVSMPVYPVPDLEKGVLGIHITPTTGGNVMFGPSAEFIKEDDSFDTTEPVMAMLKEGGAQLLPELKEYTVIRSFAGIRPKCDKAGGDFIVEESLPGFVNLIGIESPGMTASVPLGRLVCKMLGLKSGDYRVDETEESSPDRKTSHSSEEGEPALEADGGALICRCEGVTAARILKAYDDIVKIGGIPTFKGIKNRTRAFMGGCQGGYCTVDTAELLRKERGLPVELMTYDGFGSELFEGLMK